MLACGSIVCSDTPVCVGGKSGHETSGSMHVSTITISVVIGFVTTHSFVT